jgi:tRNA pseudouridine38-40 synthase
LLIAYDGTDFHGWARQPGQRTVQGAIEDALEQMLGARPKLSVAGRTDAGVHAAGQVASFAAPASLDPLRVQRSLNAQLGPEVVVEEARHVTDSFDARRSATAREYVYRIETGECPDPFTSRFVWHRPGPLSLPRMRQAASALVGEHDFASFCRAPQSDAGTVRNLRKLTIAVSGSRMDIRAVANSFLHQMVRSLVGTLAAVGEGKRNPEDVPAMLAARSRAGIWQIAPPRGLTLVHVAYGRR